MLRASLIYLSKADWARHIVANWSVAVNAASRFVAGDKLEDAIEAVKELNLKGINASLDHLGEHTTTNNEAEQATEAIEEILREINIAGVRADVSVKLTQIGLALNKELCIENLRNILTTAKETNNFVRLDMEDSPWVDDTLDICHIMHNEYKLDNTGVVIQSYLYRSKEDVEKLMADGIRVRLCKGAYKEPSDIAFPKKSDVDANYDVLTELLIKGALENGAPRLSDDGKFPPIPAIATHDQDRINFAKECVKKHDLPKDAIEFQMLYGIRRDLQEQIVKEGYPVRVYVPYGTEWYPYFVRRLAERPANLWFFLSNYLHD
jgi:proline dehydrogenase